MGADEDAIGAVAEALSAIAADEVREGGGGAPAGC